LEGDGVYTPFTGWQQAEIKKPKKGEGFFEGKKADRRYARCYNYLEGMLENAKAQPFPRNFPNELAIDQNIPDFSHFSLRRMPLLTKLGDFDLTSATNMSRLTALSSDCYRHGERFTER